MKQMLNTLFWIQYFFYGRSIRFLAPHHRRALEHALRPYANGKPRDKEAVLKAVLLEHYHTFRPFTTIDACDGEHFDWQVVIRCPGCETSGYLYFGDQPRYQDPALLREQLDNALKCLALQYPFKTQ